MTPFSILLAAVFLGNGKFSSKIVILTVGVSTVKTINFPFIVPLQFIPESQVGYGGNSWLKKLKDALLKREDYNVILVDWSRGASLPYMQAFGNTRLVGAQIAMLIKFLISTNAGSPDLADRFYIVGFSLGALIAGYAGTDLRGHGMMLGRITGTHVA